MTETHHWTVRFTIPVKYGSGTIHLTNQTTHVLAPTIDAAIRAARRRFPTLEAVWGVAHQGKIDVDATDAE